MIQRSTLSRGWLPNSLLDGATSPAHALALVASWRLGRLLGGPPAAATVARMAGIHPETVRRHRRAGRLEAPEDACGGWFAVPDAFAYAEASTLSVDQRAVLVALLSWSDPDGVTADRPWPFIEAQVRRRAGRISAARLAAAMASLRALGLLRYARASGNVRVHVQVHKLASEAPGAILVGLRDDHRMRTDCRRSGLVGAQRRWRPVGVQQVGAPLHIDTYSREIPLTKEERAADLRVFRQRSTRFRPKLPSEIWKGPMEQRIARGDRVNRKVPRAPDYEEAALNVLVASGHWTGPSATALMASAVRFGIENTTAAALHVAYRGRQGTLGERTPDRWLWDIVNCYAPTGRCFADHALHATDKRGQDRATRMEEQQRLVGALAAQRATGSQRKHREAWNEAGERPIPTGDRINWAYLDGEGIEVEDVDLDALPSSLRGVLERLGGRKALDDDPVPVARTAEMLADLAPEDLDVLANHPSVSDGVRAELASRAR